MKDYILYLVAISFLTFAGASPVLSQGTAFTYQGRFSDKGNPANGPYDMSFRLFTSAIGGSPTGPVVTTNCVPVSGGDFLVTLDFGSAPFNGQKLWLEITTASCLGGPPPPPVTLSPRQQLTPTPYAIAAGTLTGVLPAGQLSGTIPPGLLSGVYSGAVTLSSAANHFSGDGSALSGVDAITLGGFGASSFWRLLGNAGTTAGINFLGTTDNQPLELKVNSQRAFRLEPTTSTPNIIGGSSANSVSAASIGATIGGGAVNSVLESTTYNDVTHAQYATIGGGQSNLMRGSYSSIGGGSGNTVEAAYSTVAGGLGNYTGADSATIGGGRWNFVGGWGPHVPPFGCTIAGGSGNQILPGNQSDGFSSFSTISGGESNKVMYETDYSAVGGGGENSIGSWASYCFIGGGFQNTIVGNNINLSPSRNAYGYCETIGGGYANQILPFGRGATIGGGFANVASAYATTIPGGANAKASNYGQMAYASGQFAATGDAQTSVYVCRGETTGTGLTELFLDGSSERMQVPANSTWSFEVLVSGRAANGNSACYHLRGAIKNIGGTTSLVGGPNFLLLGEDVASCDASVAADNAHSALIVQVNGAAGTTMRWTATVRTAEVTF